MINFFFFFFYQEGQIGKNKNAKNRNFFYILCLGNAAFAITFKHVFIVSHYQMVSLFFD